MDYSELIENLKNLETIAYGYNINGEVLGMDCSDFEQIMVDAADAIAELNQYKELGSLDRLRELVQADREGDILYRNTPMSIYPDGDSSVEACPTCGSGEYLYNDDGAICRYCGQCGQRLDWTNDFL